MFWPVVVAATAVVLLMWERAHWYRAAKELTPERSAGVRPSWLTIACVAAAVLVCGVAVTLTAGESQEAGKRGAMVLVVDVSRSMYAGDIVPSRLERAKEVLSRALDDASDWRLAVVAFAGDAVLACPLTVDHDAVRTAIVSLNAASVREPGTAIGKGIAAALDALSDNGQKRAILLVTDGENLEGSVEPSLSKARALGVPVHVLAVGTPQGAPVPARSAPGGFQEVEQSGSSDVQPSRLDETFLRRVVTETQGRYVPVTSDLSASGIFDLEAGAELLSGFIQRPSPRRAYRYLLLVALVLLSAEQLLPSRTS